MLSFQFEYLPLLAVQELGGRLQSLERAPLPGLHPVQFQFLVG